jgi:hypothetical protein
MILDTIVIKIFMQHTVSLLSFRTDCAERIPHAPSGGHPQKHIGASLDTLCAQCCLFILYSSFSPSSHKYDIGHVKFSLHSLHYIKTLIHNTHNKGNIYINNGT